MNIGGTNELIPVHQPRIPWIVIGVVSIVFTASYASNEDRAHGDTLAIIGDKVITSDQFIKLYKEKLVRFGLTDNGTARMGYLKNLIDDEILINEAKAQHYNRTEAARAESTRIVTQELLNAYYEKHISSHVSVSDAELKDLFFKMNTKLNVRHLYANNRHKADSLYHQVIHGKSFEELARRTFNDPRLRENGGLLGYITIDEMDPAFEQAAYQLKVGEISKPIRTVQGFSIIRVDDIKVNPFTTEYDFSRVKDRLTGFARRRKNQEALSQYTAALWTDLHIRFNDPLLNKLYRVMQANPTKQIQEDTSLTFSLLEKKTIVVTSIKEKWTLNTLLHTLNNTHKNLLKWIHSKEDLRDFVAGLLMQKHITSLSKKEKLDATPAFRDRVEEEFDSYLLTAIEGDLKQQIHISEDSVREYYTHNRSKFVEPPAIRLSAILLDKKEMSDSICRFLEEGKAFAQLARQFSIQNNTAVVGGDLGFFQASELEKVKAQIFSLRKDGWTGPLVDDGKYLYVKCTDRREPREKSFEESSESIRENLVGLAWLDYRNHYIETLTHIKYKSYPQKLYAMHLQ